jgi:hypothetical protein
MSRGNEDFCSSLLLLSLLALPDIPLNLDEHQLPAVMQINRLLAQGSTGGRRFLMVTS